MLAEDTGTAAIDGALQLWDRRTGMVRHPVPHDDEVHEVEFSPDGGSFLTASIDTKARLWDTKSLKNREFLHGSAVWDALFTRDGKIVTSNSHGEIQVWDPDTGSRLHVWQDTTRGVHCRSSHACISARRSHASWSIARYW